MNLQHKKDTNDIVATFELPGLQKDDVSIDVHNNVLTVSGQSNVSSERDEDGYVVRERRQGKFTRALSLPQGLKVGLCQGCYLLKQEGADTITLQNEDIRASMENGVLTISFPKSTPETEPKKIAIN